MKSLGFIFSLFFFLLSLQQSNAALSDRFSATSTLLTPENVAIIVNDADPNSIQTAQYYLVSRKVPEKNLVHVSLMNPQASMTRQQFAFLKESVTKQLTSEQKIVLFAWSKPFAVECNSITSAFTLGFDADICKNSCGASKPNPYFNQPSKHPDRDYQLRLSMLLPSHLLDTAKKVVDNGVLSDQGAFRSSAYFLQTSDKARSSRAGFFPKNGMAIPRTGLSVVTMKSDQLLDAKDVMIYHTGKAWVSGLETLNFLPGALADHLTSYGGDLFGKGQMNVMRWLEAGATASYGTVSEPCNHWQKFPNSMVLLQWYVSGASAIEAYWKSVAWPAQGLFVGEPLAAPFAR